MDSYLKEKFEVKPKHSSEEVLQRWRNAVAVVKNRKRRFRHTANLEKRQQADAARRSIQEKLRVALYVNKAALTFIDAARDATPKTLSESVREAGFRIDADELASIVCGHDTKILKMHDGVSGIFRAVSSSPDDGIESRSLSSRQNVYGCNRYIEKPSRSFLIFVWESLQDLTLIILIVCAVVSGVVGYFTEGFPKGLYDGLGILISIFLVVIVTAVSDYKQSLQFKELDKEKQMITVQVTRDGYRQKISIFDLVVGDVVHLSIGDQVPADGLYIYGYSLSIDESSLSGESEPVNINEEKPCLLSGAKVQDGSAKMLVTAVGMRTEWGRLMETLNQGGEDETPLQVKLNGVATIIGKIGLGFAILTFVVLLARYLIQKAGDEGLLNWSLHDAKVVLDYFATAVTIIVVAVPEGLPLAVTLSLAFAMKKLMDGKSLVRHLSACETMGSATCICTDKTGTLTTNHMIVNKIWACEISKTFDRKETANEFKSLVCDDILDILLQCIFLNSGSEVVKGKDGGKTVLGNPTERALLEFGLDLGGDFEAQRQECRIKKVEPFNSIKKKMSVLVSLRGGVIRAFCKGAPEIVLQMCDKIVDGNENTVSLSENKIKDVMHVINTFANEALRTLCVAFKDKDTITSENDIPADGYTLLAVFGIKDPVRPGVKEAVEACRAAGIVVRMVTGDNIFTAKAIARECGILTDDGIAIEGQQFRNLSSQEMKNLIPDIKVMARSLPLDKHTLVTNLRTMHSEVVAVTGDGTNDAPALHEADIGFAMGITGTEVAKENADVIVLDDNFSTITYVAKWGRAVYINIQKFVQFQLTVNVVALMVNFVSACFTGEAPLTAVQLLWVNMIMDTLGALALATEPPDDGMMKRPPVGRAESFITRIMWRNIAGQSIYQLTVLGILMFDGKKLLNISGPHAEVVLKTFIFNTFVFCQVFDNNQDQEVQVNWDGFMLSKIRRSYTIKLAKNGSIGMSYYESNPDPVFNEINSREMEKFNVFRGIFSSWIFSAILIATVIFQIIIVEFCGTFASTIPLSLNLWIYGVLIGFVGMGVAVLLKCIPVHYAKIRSLDNDGYEPLQNGPEGV